MLLGKGTVLSLIKSLRVSAAIFSMVVLCGGICYGITLTNKTVRLEAVLRMRQSRVVAASEGNVKDIKISDGQGIYLDIERNGIDTTIVINTTSVRSSNVARKGMDLVAGSEIFVENHSDACWIEGSLSGDAIPWFEIGDICNIELKGFNDVSFTAIVTDFPELVNSELPAGEKAIELNGNQRLKQFVAESRLPVGTKVQVILVKSRFNRKRVYSKIGSDTTMHVLTKATSK